MIRLKLPGEMACDHDWCENALPVQLILLASGGFGFRMGQLKKPWQVQIQRGNPASPFACFCPDHSQTIETPIINGKGRLITDAH